MKSRVLILVLNWNKKDFVINLLGQIQSIKYENLECLIVDNNSDDGSVPEIKNRFPGITVLENHKNLGGTGGYNSGLRYALENMEADYIWMIDNDAEITDSTLSKLVEVMDEDRSIGIAGSRIADICHKDTTIELGSFVKWNTIGVTPYLRNRNIKHFESRYVETDYVAICSAIVRVEALRKVGVMDERHFIFWDDMDWGLQFKKAGYKVVAVFNSVAYHPSFTERKRGIATDFYYGIRNPLLVYSKHSGPLLRLKIFFTFFSNFSMYMVLMLLNRRWDNFYFAFRAIYDFISNNWGKCNLETSDKYPKNSVDLSDFNSKKALVIFDSYSDDGLEILDCLRNNIKDIQVYALIDKDRRELYKDHFDKIIEVNPDKRKTSLIYNLKIFIKIVLLKFDLSTGSNSSPYGYATKQYLIFNDDKFESTDIKNLNIYRVLISCVAGLFVSVLITPAVFISSFRYSKN